MNFDLNNFSNLISLNIKNIINCNIIIDSNILNKIAYIINYYINYKYKIAIIVDENIIEFYLSKLLTSFDELNIKYNIFKITPGEHNKSFNQFYKLCNNIIMNKFERKDIIVSFGGGMVGDLSGFVASVIYRGMKLIHIPTTLLSQIDSSIGGKTAINLKYGKNLIGSFYQPFLVISDIKTLSTLTIKEFKSGYAEIVKYSLINDKYFFAWLEKNWMFFFNDPDTRIKIITKSCKIKTKIIKLDEKELNNRALLNLGHTFGHALEACVGYNSNILNHGEGVSIGIVLAHQLSEQLNLIQSKDVKRIITHFSEVGLPTTIHDIPGKLLNIEKIMFFIKKDKKIFNNKIKLILSKGIGESFISSLIEFDTIYNFLKQKLKNKNK